MLSPSLFSFHSPSSSLPGLQGPWSQPLLSCCRTNTSQFSPTGSTVRRWRTSKYGCHSAFWILLDWRRSIILVSLVQRWAEGLKENAGVMLLMCVAVGCKVLKMYFVPLNLLHWHHHCLMLLRCTIPNSYQIFIQNSLLFVSWVAFLLNCQFWSKYSYLGVFPRFCCIQSV